MIERKRCVLKSSIGDKSQESCVNEATYHNDQHYHTRDFTLSREANCIDNLNIDGFKNEINCDGRSR
jgi:hypothetical protein